MSVLFPPNARGPALDLALPASASAIDLLLTNQTTGETLTINVPAGWGGADLTLDWHARTIRDATGADRAALLDSDDTGLWVNPEPFQVGVNSNVAIEAMRAPLKSTAKSPGTVTGTGWTNPSNAKASDNAYASISIAAEASANPLIASAFGFSLPGTARIYGFEFRIEGQAATAGVISPAVVQAESEAKGLIGDLGDSTKFLAVADSTLVLGSPANGDPAWTPAKINSATLAVNSFFHNAFNISREVKVDWLQATVYWREKAAYAATATLRWEQGYH